MIHYRFHNGNWDDQIRMQSVLCWAIWCITTQLWMPRELYSFPGRLCEMGLLWRKIGFSFLKNSRWSIIDEAGVTFRTWCISTLCTCLLPLHVRSIFQRGRLLNYIPLKSSWHSIISSLLCLQRSLDSTASVTRTQWRASRWEWMCLSWRIYSISERLSR